MCDGDTTPKLTKNKTINTSMATQTVQGRGVFRTQKLEPSVRAKLITKLPNRSWEHRGWGWNLGGNAPINTEGEKYLGFSLLPMFNLPCCLSQLNLSASQRAGGLGKCSSLQYRESRGKVEMGLSAHRYLTFIFAAFIKSHSIIPLITLPLLNEQGCLFT